MYIGLQFNIIYVLRYDGKFLALLYNFFSIKYVEMQDKDVDMQDSHVDMHENSNQMKVIKKISNIANK